MTITLPNITEALEEFKYGGIDTFIWCPNILELIVSTWNFVKLYIGGWGQHNFMPFYNSKIPEYQEQYNIEYLKEERNLTLERR